MGTPTLMGMCAMDMINIYWSYSEQLCSEYCTQLCICMAKETIPQDAHRVSLDPSPFQLLERLLPLNTLRPYHHPVFCCFFSLFSPATVYQFAYILLTVQYQPRTRRSLGKRQYNITYSRSLTAGAYEHHNLLAVIKQWKETNRRPCVYVALFYNHWLDNDSATEVARWLH